MTSEHSWTEDILGIFPPQYELMDAGCPVHDSSCSTAPAPLMLRASHLCSVLSDTDLIAYAQAWVGFTLVTPPNPS
jgi:hypothetical protein